MTQWNILYYVCACVMPGGSVNTESNTGWDSWHSAQHKAVAPLKGKCRFGNSWVSMWTRQALRKWLLSCWTDFWLWAAAVSGFKLSVGITKMGCPFQPFSFLGEIYRHVFWALIVKSSSIAFLFPLKWHFALS